MMCMSQLPVSECPVVDWLSSIMETAIGTFNKIEIVEVWVVLPQMPTGWGWTGYWQFTQTDSDIFFQCVREKYQNCSRCIKSVWENLIKIITFFSKRIFKSSCKPTDEVALFTQNNPGVFFSVHPFILIYSLN